METRSVSPPGSLRPFKPASLRGATRRGNLGLSSATPVEIASLRSQ
jgi:hypothetical protein